MNHFDAESWSDYVLGTVADAQVTLMRRHLDDGCSACSGHVAAFTAVKRMVDNERALGLAPGVVGSVKAMYRQRQVLAEATRPASRLQLVFDSYLAPSGAGVRNGHGDFRQLMFMSEDLSLDLQLLPANGDDGSRIVGEIVARDSGHLVGAPVALVAGDDVVAEAYTGELGDFELAGGRGDALKLRFELEERLELEIPPF